MAKKKPFFKYLLCAISCVFTLSVLSAWMTPAQAEVTFRPPRRQPARTNTVAGGSRGDTCTIGKTKNRAIVKVLPQSNIGLTTQQRPSIMVYVPQSSARRAFFSMEDEDFNHYYQKTLQLPQTGGVIEIKIPASVPPLVTGKDYQYSLAMICGVDLEPDDPLASGWIQRVPAKAYVVDQKASVELASRLAADGIWFDAVSTLAKLKKSQPNNQFIINSWQQLLNSAGLSEIAQEPIVN